MDEKVKRAIYEAVASEPFARALNMTLKALDDGYALVEMPYDPSVNDNIYQRAHGGAVYGLIDEAFEASCQTDGTVAVAMNVNVTYVSSPFAGAILQAESKQISQTKKTTGFYIQVTDQDNRLIATCQALAYRTGKPIPFL
jgi:acyl-CoA thioesterase